MIPSTFSPRRPRCALIATLLSVTLLPLASVHAQRPNDPMHWVGTWGAAPSSPTNNTGVATHGYKGNNQYNNQTVRLIIHPSLGGRFARVRLFNEFGTQAINIGAVHIAVLEGAGPNIVAGTDRQLTFSRNPTVSIPNAAVAVSDPVDFNLPALTNLAVSIYLPDNNTNVTTVHELGTQVDFVSPDLGGDYSGATTFPLGNVQTTNEWPLLTGIEVLAPKSTPGVVCFGDSITDGYNSTVSANHRWPDFLAARLLANNQSVSVYNAGISGNKVLVDQAGPSGLGRFERDVQVAPDASYATVLLGINDINGGATGPAVIAGHRQFIARAHAVGLKIYGCTLTPSGAAVGSAQDIARTAVNDFIRNGGEYDGVIDFDLATRDPANPTFFIPAYDSGDHLHPNDTGYQAMANSVPLTLFH